VACESKVGRSRWTSRTCLESHGAYYHDSIDKICDAYHQAKSKGTGSDNMNEIAAAAAGRVETLLIEAALQIQVK
jgi:hypothetical protein